MAPRGDRFDRIVDLARDVGRLEYTKNDLRKYLGAEIGPLNVKQSEAIITLIDMVRGIIMALGALNKEMANITINEGEIRLSVGQTAISMKKDGSLEIGGNNIKVEGKRDIEISAARDLRLKGRSVD